MITLTLGTTPVLILKPVKRRQPWALQFVPSSIIPGNTGKVYVGKGYVPTPVDGDPSQGEVLNAGASIGGGRQGDIDVPSYNGMIWAVASIAGQVCVLEGGDEDEITKP